jgi:quercetin dioxygenase-like cupin family protein
MKKLTICVLLLAVFAIASLVLAQATKKKPYISSDTRNAHKIFTPDTLKWAQLPGAAPGVMVAVLEGDPSKAGSVYTIRIKQPAGTKVPPHWHPEDEYITVIEGKAFLGMGEKFDLSNAQEVPVSGFAAVPKKMAHFAYNETELIAQVHGIGPFVINWVNPADDPSRKSSSK